MLAGLTTVNVELTSRCNKSCWCCGRRKLEQQCPELVEYGDMELVLLNKIATQLPDGIVVQLHNNGEPLLYPYLREALDAFKGKVRCFDTNGKLLKEKSDTIIGNMESIAVSVIESDEEKEAKYQMFQLREFRQLKGKHSPFVVVRALGNVNTGRYVGLCDLIVTRAIHHPMGSFQYKRIPPKPEIGICLESLNHLAIDRYGNVSMCVRFDPHGDNKIGDVNTQTLDEIWNGNKRTERLQKHISGQRSKDEFCSKCDYWGIPTG